MCSDKLENIRSFTGADVERKRSHFCSNIFIKLFFAAVCAILLYAKGLPLSVYGVILIVLNAINVIINILGMIRYPKKEIGNYADGVFLFCLGCCIIMCIHILQGRSELFLIVEYAIYVLCNFLVCFFSYYYRIVKYSSTKKKQSKVNKLTIIAFVLLGLIIARISKLFYMSQEYVIAICSVIGYLIALFCTLGSVCFLRAFLLHKYFPNS